MRDAMWVRASRWGWLLWLPLFIVGCGSPQANAQVMAVTTATLAPVELLYSPTPSPPPTGTPAPPTVTSTPTTVPTATPAPTATPVQGVYTVRSGDTLLGIALNYGLTVEELLAMNGLSGETTLRVGKALVVPRIIDVTLPPGPQVPDSEVVYGPAYLTWDTAAFLAKAGGYLARYEEAGRSGAELVDATAAKYYVGPRVLLALIELQSGWVMGEPTNLSPLGYPGGGAPNLQWQLNAAARKLMEGYYGQLEGRRDWVMLSNGVPARLAPDTTPGSAAISNVLAALSPAATLPELMQSGVFEATYRRLFGEVAGGPVRPPGNVQPEFDLPFPEAELWYLSGGPHGGWGDDISGWAAIDFAPPVASGCWVSRYPVRAIAPGLVIGSGDGEVWIDLDGDGDKRTGWVILYMHLATEGRIPSGVWVDRGQLLGYPSCEGGISNGAHLHLARMYHGQWMPAHGPVPFVLGDWEARAVIGSSYDGYLVNLSNGDRLEACDCRSARRNRFPERPPVGGR